MRRFAIAIAVVCALVPALAFAQATDAVSQIQALIAQITALQGQIQNFQGTTTAAVTTSGVTSVNATPAPTSTSASTSTCITLTRTLARGASGSDVLSLQGFLISQRLLGSDSSTGFYGALTEAAVQKFQSSNNIVSSGTAASTGYGVVGLRTRTILQQSCTPAQSATLTCPLSPLPTESCPGTWSAITDSNGCTHAWQCAVPLPSPSVPASCVNAVALSCPAGTQLQTGANCAQSCVASSVSPAAQTGTSCPVSQAPVCSSGSYLQWQGTGSTGCSLGYQCVSGISNSSVTIDQSSLTSSSAQPTITGTVSGQSGLWVLIGTVGGGENDTALLSTSLGNVTISGNTWRATVNQATISPGTYIVHVKSVNAYGGSGNLLTSGTLTITQNASCSNCNNIPFISSMTPSSGPVGTRITLTGSGFIQGTTKFLGSLIWGNPTYTVGGGGTTLTFTVPSTYTHPGPEYLCPAGATNCPASYQSQTDPVSPGTYTLALDNDGNVGQSSSVIFNVTNNSGQYLCGAGPVNVLQSTPCTASQQATL